MVFGTTGCMRRTSCTGIRKKKMLNFSKPFTKRKFTDSFLNKIIKMHNKSGNEPAKDIENSKGIL